MPRRAKASRCGPWRSSPNQAPRIVSELPFETALVVGAGGGFSASLARLLAREGLKVAVAARDAAKLAPLAAEIGGAAFSVDASEADQVAALFDRVAETSGEPDVVVYNASGRLRGP